EAVRLPLVRLLGEDLLDDTQLLEAVDLAAGRDVDFPHPPARERLEEDVLSESLGITLGHRHVPGPGGRQILTGRTLDGEHGSGGRGLYFSAPPARRAGPFVRARHGRSLADG